MDSQPTVSELSDDGEHVDELSDEATVQQNPRIRKACSEEEIVLSPAQWRQKMSRIVGSICGCARQRVGAARQTSCFKQFAGEVEELVKLQVRLHGLHKQDMDDEARVTN